jgi:aryl-alcohol dehydrogenase-like predicted oxidoreductase
MNRHILIPNTSLRISRIALGTVPWGTEVPLADARRLYEQYRAAGGNVVDTAHIYSAWLPDGAGAAERTLGQVLRATGDRRQVIVISKGGHSAESFYPRPDRYLSPERVRQDITESLERTGLDMFDLYFLHRDDARVPVGEIIDAMNAEVESGRIRYFGASNWRVERIEEANAYAAAHEDGRMGFVASQPQFSLARPNARMTADPSLRHLAPEDLAWHTRTGFAAFCYSPTARGYFATNGNKHQDEYDNPTSRQRLHRLQQLAVKLRVTPNQLALAYVLNQFFPTIPILGTTNASHLAEALQSTTVTLTPAQVAWLENGDGPAPA